MKKLNMIELRLVFLNWCINYMAGNPAPEDKQVLVMTVEYYRMKDICLEVLIKKPNEKQQ